MDIISVTTGLAIANKLLGKTAEAIAEDLKNLYSKGRDKIIEVALRKTPNINDGGQSNLRVARDVFFNGSFTDEAICAEYFGGILASSRSSDGKDDRGVYYTDIIKSLSSKQLLSHYIIYRTLNKLWAEMPSKSKRPNVGIADELQNYSIWFATMELERMGLIIDKDFIALNNKGLISDRFEAQQHKLSEEKMLPYTKVEPSMSGIQLYAVIHNKLEDWRKLPFEDFGEFPGIQLPKYYGFSIEDLIIKLNYK
jgi:hypothetical protein